MEDLVFYQKLKSQLEVSSNDCTDIYIEVCKRLNELKKKQDLKIWDKLCLLVDCTASNNCEYLNISIELLLIETIRAMDLNKILQNSSLTLEQQFKLTTDKQLLEKATKEQVVDLYIEVVKLLMLKENIIRELLKDAV